MENLKSLAEQLTSALELIQTPIAVRFGDDSLSGHVAPTKPVAAGCQFWELAATQALATTAQDHANCSIGIHTHNLANAPESQQAELEQTLTAMTGLDYVRPDEVVSIPTMPSVAKFVCYTPLAECTYEPDLVLLFANARQGLLITEAIARVDGANPRSLGRPACALVPYVMNGYKAAASLGCCGARAYIDSLDDGTMLWVLPGKQLASYLAAIDSLSKANSVLTQFHKQRLHDIASGEAPSVAESLGKLS